ncbi:putative DNA-directed RNA polymerase [Helianthus annuus]|nr:putative DNA-directed RNA polymerase [Helianthus annuus]
MVFGQCKTRVDILLSIFLWVAILNQDGYRQKARNILDNDGLASPGVIIRHQDVYCQKECPVDPHTKSHSSQATRIETYKGAEGEPAVVDRLALCSDKKQNLIVKFMIRHTRRPEVGDKFSSRHGQKGVCGTIIQQEDFPFSERGTCADLIMNPHGFPSRKMTVWKMIELLGSKAGASCGKFHYGSAFGEPSGHAHKVEDIRCIISLSISCTLIQKCEKCIITLYITLYNTI